MGKQTTEEIKKAVVIKGSVEEIINFIQEPDFLITKGRMESIAKSYMDEISWSSIALKHQNLNEEFMNDKTVMQ